MTPARVLAAAGLTLIFLTSASVALAAGRVALVVGNSTYSHIARLLNPENDAADMRRLGFDVTTAQDADRASLNEALRVFTRESVGADMALVFYAGHGLEMDGVNYLVPVDARLERDTDVRFETVALDDVLAATAGASLRLVILDACRNNPLARSMQRTRSSRRVSRGSFGDLNEDLLGDETLVAYAAAAGTTAADGTGTRNSPYTTALLTYLEQPLEIGVLFRAVRARVLETTDGKQRPHEYASLLGEHYLSGAPEAPAVAGGGVSHPSASGLAFVAAAGAPAAAVIQQETVFWQSIEDSPDPADFEAYLELFANGTFARLARNRLAAMRSSDPPAPAPPRPDPAPLLSSSDPPAPVPPPPDPAPARPRRAGEVFRDCDVCPEMVVLPGGDVAVGRYEVTVGEYRAFAAATGASAGDCLGDSWRDPSFPQTDRHPVTCVSWEDVQAYVSWLSRTTGASYRLPTEADWVRASAGSQLGCHRDRTGRPGTCPVGSFGSNGLGLSDMVGNVWEWAEDCSESGGCDYRALRGGSSGSGAGFLFPSGRSWLPSGARRPFHGLRVSRTLD